MNADVNHIWVTLEDRTGREVMRVKIPRMVPPADALQWGARLFVLHTPNVAYREATCFFVTLESQYPQSKDEILHSEEERRR